MSNYEAPLLQSTVFATFRSAGLLFPSATAGLQRRIQVYEMEFGQAGQLASTDAQNLWDVTRCLTGSATGAAVVPNSLDISDNSPLSQFLNNVTTEPTQTGAGFGLGLKQWAINQRGSYRWRALDDGDNIIIPATTGAAIMIRQLANVANQNQTAMGNISFIER
jgi:hypothetical protein